MLGAQIVPIGVGTKDRFDSTALGQIRSPQTRRTSQAGAGEIMRVPKKVSKEEIEVLHKRLQDVLVDVTTEAKNGWSTAENETMSTRSTRP